MVHFSSKNSIIAMIFYSILTFGVGPFLVRFVQRSTSKDPRDCVPGFLLGFTVSIFLWYKYGPQLVKS